MTHDQIEALIAVVDTGSFRSAAKSLHKTQSTVSAAVKKLEEEIGVTLLDRKRYRPILTPQGRSFVSKAKAVARNFNKLKVLGRQLAAGDEPSISIVLSGICALPPLLNMIKSVIRTYPQTQFSITTAHMSGVMEILNKGEADLAIGPNIGLHQGHEYDQIGSVTITSVAAPGYADGKKSPIGQREMSSNVHILVKDSGVENPVRHVNVIPGGKRWYVSDYGTKKELILAGLGWGRLPQHMITGELARGQLNEIQIEGFQNRQKIPIFIVKSTKHLSGPVCRHLWDQLTAAVLP
jgi:DNA-binding transcriptional LysR family regulator